MVNNEALNEWMETNTDINQIQAKVDKATITPKEKAAELIGKMYNLENWGHLTHIHAKKCALIAVDEILSVIWHMRVIITYDIEYWKQVKQEIEKL